MTTASCAVAVLDANGRCALMREEPEDDATSFRDTPWVEVIDVVVAGDSPLAHAVHRRQREIRCPEPVVAGHDSVI